MLVINPGEAHSGQYGSRGVEARGLTLHIPVRSLKEILAKMRFPGDLERNRVLFLDKIGDASLLPRVEELICEIGQRQSGYEIVVESIVLQDPRAPFPKLAAPVVRTERDGAGPAAAILADGADARIYELPG